MTPGEKIAIGLGVANVIGLPALILWFLRQRRKDNAEAAVAEGTVNANINLTTTASAEAHIAMLEKAYNAERASFERRIEALISEKREIASEAATYKQQLVAAQSELYELQRRVADLSRQLQEAMDKIAELLVTEDRPGVDPVP